MGRRQVDSRRSCDSRVYRLPIDAWLGSFQKCIDRAKQYDLRIIAVNRRGFSQSTRLAEHDLNLLNSKIKDNHTVFLEDRARELAQVLVMLGTTTGNHASISLLGWSLGNVFCLKMVEMMEANALGALNLQLQRLMSDYIIYGGLALLVTSDN
jgi:pimeloyl-ACP methyl ester carboxylesterase